MQVDFKVFLFLSAQIKNIMTKEEYLLKRRQLDRQYCCESGLIGKKLLSWVEQEKDLWVHIFVVKTISIGRENDLWINTSTKENYEVFWEGNDNTGLTLGEEDNLIDAEVDCFDEIDEIDFNIVKEILINGKNSDRLELYRKASDYLRSKGIYC